MLQIRMLMFLQTAILFSEPAYKLSLCFFPENDQMDEDVGGGEQVNEENDQIDEDVGGGATGTVIVSISCK